MTPDAIALRDAAYTRLATMVGSDPVQYLFRYIGKVPIEQEPDDQLPSLLVIASNEQMQADGDAVDGPPRFINSLTLNMLVSLSGNDRDRCDTRLSTRMTAVMSTLLCDPTFVVLFEGVESASATRQFDKDGERFFARAHIVLVLQYRTQFDPVIPDDFKQVGIYIRSPHDPRGVNDLYEEIDIP